MTGWAAGLSAARHFVRRLREPAIALAACGLVLIVAQLARDDPTLRGFETASLDLRFQVRGARPPSDRVVVVLVDDKSLARLGRWPIDRRVLAQAVTMLTADGAKAIAFDMLFPEPQEVASPTIQSAMREAAARLGGDSDHELHDRLEAIVRDDPDEAFARAIKQSGRVLLPLGFEFTGKPGPTPDYLSDFAYQKLVSQAPYDASLRPVSALLPIARLATAAAGVAHVNVAFDRDGEIRYDYLALPYGGDFIASMPVRLAALSMGLDWSEVGLELGDGVTLGNEHVPGDKAMRLLVNYPGPSGTIPHRSLSDLVEGSLDPSMFHGRAVVIGASFLANADSFRAPFDSTPITGAERLAGITQSILQQDFITSPPSSVLLAFELAVCLTAGLIGASVPWVPSRLGALPGSAAIAVLLAVEQAAFDRGLWLPLVAPGTAILAATASVLLFRYWFIDREGRKVRSTFRRYVAPQLVDILAAHPERLVLGGETRSLTILFSDLRGFTTIAERFKADPQGLTRLINRFLGPMTDTILSTGGTIDKYIGDCIMAFWNAPLDTPDHPALACAAALRMQQRLAQLNAALAEEHAIAGGTPVRLAAGIGLNTGDCVVGNLGSDRRFDYSVLGDAVNLASRLEAQCRFYEVDIILGEDTEAGAVGFATLELDLIRVVGKTEPARIYALLGDRTAAMDPGFVELKAGHAAMLEAYRSGDWPAARNAIRPLQGRDPRLARLYELYVERLDQCEAEPVPPGWTGVYVSQSKHV